VRHMIRQVRQAASAPVPRVGRAKADISIRLVVASIG
jgi:hypothetical protein